MYDKKFKHYQNDYISMFLNIDMLWTAKIETYPIPSKKGKVLETELVLQ